MTAPSPPIRFTGSVNFAQPIVTVWNLLSTPEQTSRCVPGISNWKEIIKNQEYQLVLDWLDQSQSKLSVPMNIKWDHLDPPDNLHLSAVAALTSSTQLQINGRITLTSLSSHMTQLDFTAELFPPNPFLSQVIKNIFPKQIDRFFACLKTKLTERNI